MYSEQAEKLRDPTSGLASIGRSAEKGRPLYRHGFDLAPIWDEKPSSFERSRAMPSIVAQQQDRSPGETLLAK